MAEEPLCGDTVIKVIIIIIIIVIDYQAKYPPMGRCYMPPTTNYHLTVNFVPRYWPDFPPEGNKHEPWCRLLPPQDCNQRTYY